uniref:GDT1 family protein n=1 Tax=Anopheles atroparvus TaxID=41427 RepID=A0AAG5DIC3_ANOAO
MSGKSVMNKFVIRNIVQRFVNCTYVCVFYLMLLCMLDTAGIGADKMPQEDISVVTEVDELSPNGSSGAPTEGKGLLSSDIGFVHAFAASFMVIIVSELGDKTFFIAAIMAMRHPRLTVFAGAIAALALMTVLSVVFGMAATIIPRVYTFYISTALFALFGLKMLYDGYRMSATEAAEELEEVQSDLRKRDDELARSISNGRKDTVELYPLGDTEEEAASKQKPKPMLSRTGTATSSLGSAILATSHRRLNNGSIHSLAEQGLHEASAAAAAVAASSSGSGTMRLSSSASQLYGPNGPMEAAARNTGISTGESGETGGSLAKSPIGDSTGDGVGGAALDAREPDRTTTLATSNGGANLGSEQRQRLRIANGIDNNNLMAGTHGGTGGGAATGGTPHATLEREVSAGGGLMVQDAESGASRRGSTRGRLNNNSAALKLLFRIFMQAFTMTFVAEWGDRSQLTTIILSARENVYGVIAGGVIGHSICTGLAVIGGRMIAQRISVRTVTLIGGVVFLLFALSALLFGPGEEEPVKVPIP